MAKRLKDAERRAVILAAGSLVERAVRPALADTRPELRDAMRREVIGFLRDIDLEAMPDADGLGLCDTGAD